MPIKLHAHDNTSTVEIAPTDNTIADKRLYILIKEETKNRIAEDENLQQQIEEIVETGAGTIAIDEKDNGSIDVSLLNTKGEVLSTVTIHLTEKIIKSGIVDYAHSKVIFTCNDNSTIEVDISDIVNAVIAENNRAMAAEAVLGQRIDSEAATRQQADLALNDAISLENTRATGVENQLRSDLTTETNARTAADTQLQSNLDAEAHERSIHDESLSTRISNEAGTRLAADDALNARIDALDLATVGAAGSYLKTISQSDGQVAATAQQFDTVINYEATDLNAPTTKAVRDFVDSDGGKIDTISINGVNQPVVNKNVDLPAYPTRVSLNINNVDNTADLDKPVSTATQTALNKKQNTIDQEHKLSSDFVDDSGHTNKFATQAQLDQISTNKSDIATLNSTVSGHVANTSNPHNVTKTQVGLGNVDNTSDLDKPVSTLQQEALDTKQDVIDSSHKLASDLVDDSASTNKFVTASDLVDIAANTAARHTHTNFALLETYAQTEVNLADAVAKKHSHSNKAILDSTEEAYTTFLHNKLQGIEAGAEVNEIEGIQRNGVDLVPDSNRKVNIVVPTQTSDLTNNGDGTSNFATVNYVDTEIATKQPTIDPSNPLDADSVDDTTSNHKFVTASEKSQITTNQTDIANLDSTLDAHIANTSNPHAVTKTQVGLGNVENTGDSDTPAQGGLTKFTTGGAYTMQTTLQGNINTVDDKLNHNVHIENGDEMSYNGDTVTKTSGYRNLKTGATGTRSEVIHLANSTTAGLMSYTDYNTIQDNKRRIDALEGTPVRLIYTASQNPTAAQIKTFVDNYLAGKGIVNPTDSDYNSVSVKISGTNHIWNYYANDGAYKDDGLDTVTQFTNSVAGVILGSSNDGQVFAENDGTGSVYGWSALKTRVGNLETADVAIQQDITALQNNKVDKVTGKDLSTNDFTNAYKADVDLNTAARHTHSNLALLESYNQTNDALSEAVLKTHEHSNKTILDNTTASYTTGEATKLSGIEAGAEVNDIVGIQRNSVDLTPDANRKVNIVVPTQTSDLTNNGDGTSNFATESYVATEIAAKQNTIDASHPLNADFVDDSTSAHKFVSAADLTNIAANTSARHTHTNFSLLETYTQTNTDLANAVSKAHEHTNKSLLDSYDQTNANITDAVSKKHEHTNKTILDNTTASFTTAKDTKLGGIEAGAEVNEIEGVSVNGTTLTPDANRIVSLTVPTKTSDITNDGEGGLSKFATENYVDTAVNNKQPTIDSAHPLNADYVDDSTSDHKFVSAADLTNIASNTAARHTHNNYALLEDYTQTNAALSDAVTKAHTHSNKSVLDDTSAAFTTTKDTKLSGIETGAEVNDIVSISVNNSALTPDANRNVNIDLSVYALEGDLSTVATTGSYTDLSNTPSIPTKNSWNYDDRYVKYNDTQSLNDTEKARARSNIGAGTSNFSGSYNDLVDKPTIPVVYDGTLYLQKNGATIATFTANQSGDTTANFTIPTNLDDVPDGQTRKLSNYLPTTGGTLTGPLFITGDDLQFSTPNASSNDSGDIVFRYGNGNEKSRIWTDNVYSSGIGPNYRVFTENGTELYSGRLATLADIPSLSGYATETWVSTNFLGKTAKAADSDKLDGYDSSYFAAASSLDNYAHKSAKTYTSVDALTDSGDGWYNLFQLNDSSDGAVFGIIKSYAHSSMTFIVHKGYDTSASCQILGYNDSINGSYFCIKALRVVSGGVVQGLFNRPAANSGSYISVNINLFSSHDNFQAFDTLTLETGSPTVIAGPAYGYKGKITSDIAGDADTLDGYHASYFYPASNPSGFITGITQQDVTSALNLGTVNNSTYWGTLTEANGYTIRWGSDQPSGGGLVFAEKSGQTSMQLDGEIYVGEGQYRLAHMGEAQPASDVYSWAKQPSKPSYNFSEIGAGTAVVDYNGGIVFRNETSSWYSGIYYSTPNEESVVFANKSRGNQDNAYQQQWLFAYTDMQNRESWRDLGSKTAMQIKGHRVAINKMVDTSQQIPYNLDVNGSANATTVTVNTKVTMQYNSNEDCLDFVFA